MQFLQCKLNVRNDDSKLYELRSNNVLFTDEEFLVQNSKFTK